MDLIFDLMCDRSSHQPYQAVIFQNGDLIQPNKTFSIVTFNNTTRPVLLTVTRPIGQRQADLLRARVRACALFHQDKVRKAALKVTHEG